MKSYSNITAALLSIALIAFQLQAQPIGTTITVGTTWNDIQANGTVSRLIGTDYNSNTHITWMNGLNSGASQRHIYYNLITPEDSLLYPGGLQIDQNVSAGYPCLALDPAGYFRIAYHCGDGISPYGTIALTYTIPDFPAPITVYMNQFPIELLWPKIARDISDRIHFIITTNPSQPGEPNCLHYCRGEFEMSGFSMSFSDLEFIDSLMVNGYTAAASPVSDRVAIGWLEMGATGSCNCYDNNVIVCVSEDGTTWNWSDTMNVTNFIPPDSSLLPDTTLANMDTLRAYTSLCLFFDSRDILHITFAVRGYYAIPGLLNWGNSFIYHWDEENLETHIVADGWYEQHGWCDPGAWNIYISRSSLSEDTTNGNLYCIYQRYLSEDDTTDISAAGYPNGEIWCSVSTDYGVTWSEGTNLTNTHTPDALPNNCASEITPSSALFAEGELRLMYVLDYDAGAVVQNEGTWTLNDVIYQHIPLEQIPAAPLIPDWPPLNVEHGVSVNHQPPTASLPLNPVIEYCYPNPFNSEIVIRYDVPASSEITLAIYDLLGRETACLATGFHTPGEYTTSWKPDGKNPSGIYFAKLSGNSSNGQTMKIIYLK